MAVDWSSIGTVTGPDHAAVAGQLHTLAKTSPDQEDINIAVQLLAEAGFIDLARHLDEARTQHPVKTLLISAAFQVLSEKDAPPVGDDDDTDPMMRSL